MNACEQCNTEKTIKALSTCSLTMSDTEYDADTPPGNIRPVDVVTRLTENDVLLGRGAPIINYEGNVRFRSLVSTRKAEYNSTSRHQIKDEIARQIAMDIKQRNGRFLRKVKSNEETQQFRIPVGEAAWTVADEIVILEKVKQALRDREPEKRIRQSESSDAVQQQQHQQQQIAVAGVELSNAERDHLVLPALSSSQGISLMGGQSLLPLESVARNISTTSSLLSQLSNWNYQNTLAGISASTIAQRPHENYIALLRQQQQQQSLLSHIAASPPRIDPNAYLQVALLQQQANRNSLLTQSDTPAINYGIRPDNASSSIFGVYANRAIDSSLTLPISGIQAHNLDEQLALNRQTQIGLTPTSTIPIHSAFGLSTARTLNSLSDLQHYANNEIVRREQQRLELQRQALLASNIRATYFAESRIPQQLNDALVPGFQTDGNTVSSASLTAVSQIADDDNNNTGVAVFDVTERASHPLQPCGNSNTNGDHPTIADPPNNSTDRKRKTKSDGTDSSASSSSSLLVAATRKKPRA